MRLTATQIIEELELMKSDFEQKHTDGDVSEAYEDAIEAVKMAFMKEAWHYIQEGGENDRRKSIRSFREHNDYL